jgi:hypothetical protein
MDVRIASRFAAGALVVLAVGASIVSAQDTSRARSQRRIPISKEPPPPRVDTITLYRTDTLRMERVDTVHTTRTVTRVDTVERLVRPVVRLPNGWYYGLAGGSVVPAGALFNPYGAGFTVQGQVGWQLAKGVVGGRFDAGYTQFGEDSQYALLGPDPDIWNFNLGAKAQVPYLNHLWGASPRFNVYGIGGATLTAYKGLSFELNSDQPGFGAANVSTPDGDWHNKWGWNAGGGASVLWGRSEIFVEARVLAFKYSNTPQARQVPIILGYNFY